MNAEFSHISLNGQTVAISVRNDRIADIIPQNGPAQQIAIPPLVEPHVHLDKSFTVSRCRPEKSGLFGAIEAMQADVVNWTDTDLRMRMSRGLEEAYRFGTFALRSHVDWLKQDTPRAWDILGELAQDWQHRMVVQRASLSPLDLLGDVEAGDRIAKSVSKTNGVLGCFVYRNANANGLLRTVFSLAAKYDLDLDFHVDEGLEVEADAFDHIVALTNEFKRHGRVLCGHACSLSIRPKDEVIRIIAQTAEAGVALSVMPTTNLWLQDHQSGRTPRQRGLAPLQEMRAAGVDVLLGADNVADPFYPFGSYDPVETLRLAALAGHLSPDVWLDSITTTAGRVMGVQTPEIAVGAPADFVLIKGSDWNEAMRTPGVEREIFRQGRHIQKGDRAA